MRYFLLFFICLFLNFASYATDVGEKMPHSFMLTVQEKAETIQKSLNESMKVERGLLTGEKGLTPFYETEFARFRLTSCSGGIPENHRLFLMVESQIKEGWRLQKPVIPHSEKLDSSIVDEKIAYPLNIKENKKTSFYEDSAFFALLYEVNPKSNVFGIKKEISFTACKENLCKTEVVPFEMVLDRSNTYQTDVCASMLHEFQNVPTEPNAGELSAVLNQIDKNYLVLKLEFERDISYVKLQIEEEFDWKRFIIVGLLIAIIILIFTSVRGKKGKKDGQVDAANVTPIADATVTPVMDASVPVVAADPMAASAVAPMNVNPGVDPMATVTPVVDANQVMAAAPVAATPIPPATFTAPPVACPVVLPLLTPTSLYLFAAAIASSLTPIACCFLSVSVKSI